MRGIIDIIHYQMLKISAHIEGVAKKKDEDDAAIEELEELFNMVLCDVKVPSEQIPIATRKRTYKRQDKSMFFPKPKKRGRRKKPYKRLEGTLSEVQKGLAYEPKDREW